MAQPESRLSRAIMTAMRARGIWCVKIHGGPLMAAGTPDILACVPVHTPGGSIGVFVAFETKMPEGKVSLIQAHVHEKIKTAYGRVFVPRSVEDAVAALYAVGYTDPPDTP